MVEYYPEHSRIKLIKALNKPGEDKMTNKNKPRLKKGQKVYRACTHFGSIRINELDITIMTVIERTVDACGKKQMTFYDNGFDVVFGKSILLKYATEYFDTREEAYDFLQGYKEKWDNPNRIHNILVGEYNDQDEKAFEDYDRIYKKDK